MTPPSRLIGIWFGFTSWAKCRLGFHIWGGHESPGPDSWRCCAACDREEEGAYDGIQPFWRRVR